MVDSVVAHDLLQIFPDAVLIAVFLGLKFAAYLVAEFEGDAGIDNCLAVEYIPVVFHGDVDLGKDFVIRLPTEAGAGLFPVHGLFFQAADVPTLFKVEGVLEAVPADGGIEVGGGVLGGARAKTI